MTTTWSEQDLALIAETDDLYVSPFREDGSTYGTPTRVWSVVVDGNVYSRAASGPESSWYVAAITQRAGRVRVANADHDVTFAEATEPAVADAIDAAYAAKYDPSSAVPTMQGAGPRSATVQITPR